MIGCLFRGTQGVYKPRSRADLGTGSHSGCQSLVGRLNKPVQIPDEHMDSVQAGGIAACTPWTRPLSICASVTCAIPAALTGAVKTTPSPLPLTVAIGVYPRNFPYFFLDRSSLFFLTCETITKRSN